MKCILKKGLAMIVSISSILAMGVTSFALDMDKTNSIQNLQGDDGTVFRVDVPDENGNYITLRGLEAQKWYDDAVIETKKNLIEDEKCTKENINSKSNTDSEEKAISRGAFHYRYRYIESEHKKDVKRNDLKTNVTNELTNETSLTQSYDLNLKVSQSWTINSEVTGRYKKAVTAALGGSWGKSYSKSETLHVNIAPGETVQVQFIPIMDKSVGESQKYFIPRGPGHKEPYIEKSVKVTTYSPKYTRCKVGPFSFKTVYGAYVWKSK